MMGSVGFHILRGSALIGRAIEDIEREYDVEIRTDFLLPLDNPIKEGSYIVVEGTYENIMKVFDAGI